MKHTLSEDELNIQRVKQTLPEEIECLVRWEIDTKDGIPRIEEVKPSLPCPDCGMRLKRQRIEDHKIITIPFPTWRSHCSACRMFKNPLTGEYDLTNSGLRAVLNQIHLDKDK